MSIDIAPFLRMAAQMAQAGHMEIARDTVQDILARQPDAVEALRLLAKIEFGMGDVAAGTERMRAAIDRAPGRADLHYELGSLLAAKDQFIDAAVELGRAAELDPAQPDYSYNLGCAFSAIEMHEQAIASFRRALEHAPEYPRAHQNMGYSLLSIASWAEAAEAFEQAIKLDPESQESIIGLGVALRGDGRDADADDLMERLAGDDGSNGALLDLATFELRRSGGREVIDLLYTLHRKDPEAPGPLVKLAIALERVGRIYEIAPALIKGAIAHPDNGMLMCMAGVALVKMGEVDERTESVLLRSYSLLPDNSTVSNALGSLHFQRGDVDKAVEWYYRAHLLRPLDSTIHSNLLFTLRHTDFLNPEELFLEHKRFGEILEAIIQPFPQRKLQATDADRRLRLGFVSPDFCRHVVMMFLEPYLDHIDREKFEVFLYYTNGYQDEITQRAQEKADGWRHVATLTHEDTAKLIRDDEIDILIDLAGHTAKNGLPIFAYKPAPMQISWLGYPGTTGLTRIDYRFSDASAQPHSTETVIPGHRIAFRPPAGSPPVAPVPALEKGYVTFACVNKLLKVSPSALRAWAEIIHRVPNSRLVFVASSTEHEAIQTRMRDIFADLGLDPSRLEIRPRMPLLDFLAFFRDVDIALEPYPYCGGTTALLTAWMGVPFIAMSSDVENGRAAAGLLHNTGLGALIGECEASYVEAAVALSQDMERLTKIRASLRDRMSEVFLKQDRELAHLFTAELRARWKETVAKHISASSPGAAGVAVKEGV